MISFDSRQLQILEDFAGFVSFLKNPDKYTSIIDEAKKILSEMKAIVGPYSTVEEANKYLYQTQEKYLKAEKEIEVKKNMVLSSLDSAKASFEKDKENIFSEIKKLEEKTKLALAEATEKLEASKKAYEEAEEEKNKAIQNNSDLAKKIKFHEQAKEEYETMVEKLKSVIK